MTSQICKECKAKEKLLSIAQADADFEIKKMSEDLAEQKVILEMQYQKDIKRALEKYNKEKQEREQENKNWLAKYDAMVREYEGKIRSMEQIHHLSQEKIKNEMVGIYHKRERETLKSHQNFVSTLKKEHEDTVFTLKKSQDQQIATLQRHEAEALQSLQNSHDGEVASLKHQYQQKVRKLKEDMGQIMKSSDRLKMQASQTKAALYQELYERKQEISSLKYKIDHLNLTIKNCQDQLRFKNHEIETLKQQHEETLSDMHYKFQAEKTQLIQQYNEQIEEILTNKLKDCDLFEQNVNEIQRKRENELQLYENSLKEVKELVEVRPSRTEDVEQINILKELLSHKQKEIQKVMEEVKTYKLELNYKDSTINRIFSANQNPLNIERIVSKKKQSLKSTKGSLSLLKDSSKYNSVGTFNFIPQTHTQPRKDKLHIQARSSKIVC